MSRHKVLDTEPIVVVSPAMNHLEASPGAEFAKLLAAVLVEVFGDD